MPRETDKVIRISETNHSVLAGMVGHHGCKSIDDSLTRVINLAKPKLRKP